MHTIGLDIVERDDVVISWNIRQRFDAKLGKSREELLDQLHLVWQCRYPSWALTLNPIVVLIGRLGNKQQPKKSGVWGSDKVIEGARMLS